MSTNTESAALAALASIVANNLENQHDWTNVKIHSQENLLPRQLIYGLPPKRLYVHPDEQIETIKAEKELKEKIPQNPEYEWVLPVHLAEKKWTVGQFAALFDAIDAIPPFAAHESSSTSTQPAVDPRWEPWRGPNRMKRILLATVQDDSTVTYYFMHDGLVKPRQN